MPSRTTKPVGVRLKNRSVDWLDAESARRGITRQALMTEVFGLGAGVYLSKTPESRALWDETKET